MQEARILTPSAPSYPQKFAIGYIEKIEQIIF